MYDVLICCSSITMYISSGFIHLGEDGLVKIGECAVSLLYVLDALLQIKCVVPIGFGVCRISQLVLTEMSIANLATNP